MTHPDRSGSDKRDPSFLLFDCVLKALSIFWPLAYEISELERGQPHPGLSPGIFPKAPTSSSGREENVSQGYPLARLGQYS